MIRTLSLVLLCLLISQSVFAIPEENTTFIYSIVETETGFQLTRFDVVTEETRIVHEFPKQTSETFALLAPQSEVELASEEWHDRRLRVRPYRLAVSPDQQHVAVLVTYEDYPLRNWQVIGFEEILVFGSSDDQPRSVWKMGLHDSTFTEGTLDSYEKHIGRLEWTPDQAGLIAGLQIGRGYGYKIIAIPLLTRTPPFVVGQTLIDHTVLSENTIIAYSSDSAEALGLTQYIYDLKLGSVTQTTHLFEDYYLPIHHVTATPDIMFIGSGLPITAPDSDLDLIFLDPSVLSHPDDPWPLIEFPHVGEFLFGDMKAVGDWFYIMPEGRSSIWRMSIEGGEMVFKPYLSIPWTIDTWDISAKGDLLISYKDSDHLSVVYDIENTSNGVIPTTILRVKSEFDSFQETVIDW